MPQTIEYAHTAESQLATLEYLVSRTEEPSSDVCGVVYCTHPHVYQVEHSYRFYADIRSNVNDEKLLADVVVANPCLAAIRQALATHRGIALTLGAHWFIADYWMPAVGDKF